MLETKPRRLQDGWPVAGFEEASLDPQSIAGLTRWIEENHVYHNTHAVLIQHAGHLVYEVYLEGEDRRWEDPPAHRVMNIDSLHDIRSVSKSVTSLLLGIALKDNFEQTLATPVTELFSDRGIAFADGADKVTFKHVLTMASGFEWDHHTLPFSDPRNDNHRLYMVAEDPVALILSKPLVDTPGATLNYSDALTEVVAAVVEQRVDKSIDEFAAKVLFGPLGIDKFEWLGGSTWKPEGRPAAGAGLRLRARDLAKIGSLVLHNGAWKGRQIVPADWLKLSFQPHVRDGLQDFRGTFGYGFQWWIGRSGSIPAYSFIAGFGLGGQQLLVVPERHLVVTIFAGNYDREYADGLNWILNQVTAAHRRHP